MTAVFVGAVLVIGVVAGALLFLTRQIEREPKPWLDRELLSEQRKRISQPERSRRRYDGGGTA